MAFYLIHLPPPHIFIDILYNHKDRKSTCDVFNLQSKYSTGTCSFNELFNQYVVIYRTLFLLQWHTSCVCCKTPWVNTQTHRLHCVLTDSIVYHTLSPVRSIDCLTPTAKIPIPRVGQMREFSHLVTWSALLTLQFISLSHNSAPPPQLLKCKERKKMYVNACTEKYDSQNTVSTA